MNFYLHHLIHLNNFRKLLFLLIIITSLEVKSRDITVGYFQLSPHSNFQTDKSNKGIALEYFEILAKEMNLKQFTFKELPLPRLIQELSESRIDIGLYLAKNNERETKVNFSQSPFLIMEPSIVTLKNKGTKEVVSEDDIKGLTLCVWQEGYQSPIIKSEIIKKIQLTGMNVTSRCLELVKIGRADGFYTPDILSLKFEIKTLNLENLYDIKVLAKNEVGLYTVFSKKLDPKIIHDYQNALKKISKKIPYTDFYLNRLKISN